MKRITARYVCVFKTCLSNLSFRITQSAKNDYSADTGDLNM